MSERRSATLAVHGPERAPRSPVPRGMAEPIYQSVTYDLDARAYADIAATGGAETVWYTRLGNPTVDAAAARLGALEGAHDVVLLASGMAAISTTLLAVVPPGGTVVASRALYGDALTFLRDELPRHGRRTTFVDLEDHEAWRTALDGDAAALYVETVSNPMLRVADLDALAAMARAAGVTAIVDATFTPPVGLRCLEHGFDVVVHSATKFLNGHSDVVAGAVAGSGSALARVRGLAPVLGAAVDPHAAFLLDRGMRTLALRVERQREAALAVARALQGFDEVEAVHHPLLADHPDHALAQRLIPDGAALVTIRVAGGDRRALRMLDALELVRQATSLGGLETLASAPHNTSHLGLSEAERRTLGIAPGTLRLSIGIEDVADLLFDVERALTRTARARAA